MKTYQRRDYWGRAQTVTVNTRGKVWMRCARKVCRWADYADARTRRCPRCGQRTLAKSSPPQPT